MSIDFTGRVALVTGAGGGLGRSHALELARRGARVVVNDLGSAVDGSGGSSKAAEAVVAEIVDMGGEAIADGASVADRKGVENMLARTMEAFGRVDILINNAGILRDKSFAKMSLEDFETVLDVHLKGAVYASHAVWPIMREQGYGRIVMTTSSTGLYGNFGQSNYGTAKLGQVGLMHTLKLEGAKYNIHVNTVCPIAATRMTETVFPEELLELFGPELVTPAVIFLASEQAPNGEILCTGGGHFAKAQIVESPGAYLGSSPTADDVLDRFEEIVDMRGGEPHEAGNTQTEKFAMRALAHRRKNA